MNDHDTRAAVTDTAFEFPCRFPVKAMTRAGDGYVNDVIEAVREHAAVDPDNGVTLRDSRNGRYQSVTVTVTVESRDHLERIYTAVNALDAVLMTL